MEVTLQGSLLSRTWDDEELAVIAVDFAAFDGQVGIGEFPVPDPAATDDVYGHRQLKVTENTATVLLDGWVDDQQRSRHGRERITTRLNSYGLLDDNALLYGFRVTAWVRPAETDRARMLAFAAAYLPTLDTTWVLNTNTVSLPAKTYNSDGITEIARDVIDWAGKTVFVEGRRLHSHLLTEGRTCGLSITDNSASVNDTTVFAPGNPRRVRTPADLANSIRAVGNAWITTVSDATSITNHDADGLKHEATIEFGDATSSSDLTALANKALAEAKDERLTYFVSIGPLDWVSAALVRVGDLLMITSQAVGLTASVQRVAHMTLRVWRGKDGKPAPGFWQADLELGSPARFGRRRRGSPINPDTVQAVLSDGASLDFDAYQLLRTDGALAAAWTSELQAGAGNWNWDHIISTQAPCGIGIDAWRGQQRMYGGLRTQTALPADDSAWIGARLDLYWTQPTGRPGYNHSVTGFQTAAGALANRQVPGPYKVYWTLGDKAAGLVPSDAGSGMLVGIAYSGTTSPESVSILVPRSALTFGKRNALTIVPDWDLYGYYWCNTEILLGYSNDGYVAFTPSGGTDLTMVSLMAGTYGWLTAAPLGTQDGSNRTFTLIGGYERVDAVWKNGILQPPDSYTATDYSTITLDWAPLPEDTFLVRYYVPR